MENKRSDHMGILRDLGFRKRHRVSKAFKDWYYVEYEHRRGVRPRNILWLKRKTLRTEERPPYFFNYPIEKVEEAIITETDKLRESTTIADPGGSGTLPGGKPGKQPFVPV